jgi:hypothetical protein
MPKIACGCLVIFFILFLICYGIGSYMMSPDYIRGPGWRERDDADKQFAKEEWERAVAEDPNPVIKEPVTAAGGPAEKADYYQPELGISCKKFWNGLLGYYGAKDPTDFEFGKSIEIGNVTIGAVGDNFRVYGDLEGTKTVSVSYNRKMPANMSKIVYHFADSSGSTKSSIDNFILVETAVWFNDGYIRDSGIFDRLSKLLAQKYGTPQIEKLYEVSSGYNIYRATYTRSLNVKCFLVVHKDSFAIRNVSDITKAVSVKKAAAERNKGLDEKKDQEAVIRGF